MIQDKRCPETLPESGPSGRVRHLRCQCSYHRKGSQGGTLIRWWGANPRPVGWLGDRSRVGLVQEISRLRDLCEYHGIDWKSGLSGAS
jgi:hypothetical protein